jgi:hypothetical protein
VYICVIEKKSSTKPIGLRAVKIRKERKIYEKKEFQNPPEPDVDLKPVQSQPKGGK